MKWFEGSINDAVAASKSRKAIFVVFVEGKDETSSQVAYAIDTAEVSARLEQEDFVAIRLESGTETYRFFAQIYQLVPVPSLFFIGENGIPLEIVAGSTTAAELISKIDSVLTKAGRNLKNSSMNLIQAEQKVNVDNTSTSVASADTNKSNESESKAEAEQVLNESVLPEVAKSENIQKEVLVQNDVCEPSTSIQNVDMEAKKETNEETNDTSNNKELTPEEKLEKARQLIEIQRKQRIEEEERKERERELERRRIGRDVQKMRQKQQDLEAKQAHEERMKEKAAEVAAREKVRQQIAQDKLERKQRELALQQQNQQSQVQEQTKPPAPIPGDETLTRIQFRLPAGNPHMGRFEPNTTLRALRDYVQQNIDLPFRQFVMSTSFPRRELSTENDNKTLLELELVPTAVILILPLKNVNPTTSVTSSQDVGFFSRFIWSFFTPLISIYNYLFGYFNGGGRPNTDRPHDDSRDTTASPDNRAPSHFQNITQSGPFRRNLNIRGGTTIRSEGNIHRLHSGGDDNDENNTWNGNSTQQM